MQKEPLAQEARSVEERYARRQGRIGADWYDPLSASVCLSRQEIERALVRWINDCGLAPLESKSLLEVGCGMGSNLLTLLRLGFDPALIIGNELLPDRVEIARRRLPAATRILEGDATRLNLPDASFDVVYQSMVFTSLLDDAFQQTLANRMWALIKPGGGVLWYDFIFNNPNNPDVRGVALSRVRALFPEGKIRTWRLTLAPPISRRVTRIHPSLYSVFNALPFLRTHILCWIEKPRS